MIFPLFVSRIVMLTFSLLPSGVFSDSFEALLDLTRKQAFEKYFFFLLDFLFPRIKVTEKGGVMITDRPSRVCFVL